MGWKVACAGTELKYRNSRERERDKLNCLQGRNIGGFHHRTIGTNRQIKADPAKTKVIILVENKSSSSQIEMKYFLLRPEKQPYTWTRR